MLSEFYGMVILMYKNEETKPHVEVIDGGEVSRVAIDSYKKIYAGDLNIDALDILQEWIDQHKEILIENWKTTQKNSPNYINP